MARTRYRYDRELQKLVEIPTVEEAGGRGAPQILAGLEPYESPVTGERILGRRARARDLAAHGCIDARDAPSREEGAKIRQRNTERNISEGIDHAVRTFFERR